ncbi:hypothetical protein [Mycobacteroides chelonae]|nr:hypothetical protein [Mycobacteroides chelonae]
MASISSISASTTGGSSTVRDVYGSMELGAAIVVHCVIAISFRCQHRTGQ